MPAKKSTKKTAKKAAKKVAKKTAKKAAKKVAKKVPAKKAAKKTAKKAVAKSKPIPTHQQIEEAAYYCFLERCEKGLPGDSRTDWIMAVNQLTS